MSYLLGQIVDKSCQADMTSHDLLWAGADEVEGVGDVVQAGHGDAGQVGGEVARDREKEERDH